MSSYLVCSHSHNIKSYVTGAFKSAVGVDAHVLAGPVPVVGHALVNVVAVRARRRVTLRTDTWESTKSLIFFGIQKLEISCWVPSFLTCVSSWLVDALVDAAAVVDPALVVVDARRHVLDVEALVAEARRHARHHPALVVAPVRAGARLFVIVITRRILVI